MLFLLTVRVEMVGPAISLGAASLAWIITFVDTAVNLAESSTTSFLFHARLRNIGVN
jgi:hypothetical protein